MAGLLTPIRLLMQAYLNRGVKVNGDDEANRQAVIINLFSFVGLSLTFLLGINALVDQRMALTLALWMASALFFAAHLLHSYAPIGKTIAANLLMLCLMGLSVYLVYTGGFKGTGPLWIYLVPPVALAFKGLRLGLRDTGLFILCVGLILYYPENQLNAAIYTPEFKSRLLLSFLTVTFLFAFYEYSRQQTFRSMQRLSRKFEQQAKQDQLTKLPNRRGMLESLKYEYHRSQRSQRPMTLLLVDVDHFKLINDSHGHDIGDRVLQQLAEVLSNSMRKQDIAARWGGEEFLIMLPETNQLEAATLAERLRQAVAAYPFTTDDSTIRVCISGGLCEVQLEGSIERAISLADKRLYQAKDAGRNRIIN